ncbi:MAG: hypothetical protein Q9227_004494 [Pyrenula ochraceoflavens]
MEGTSRKVLSAERPSDDSEAKVGEKSGPVVEKTPEEYIEKPETSIQQVSSPYFERNGAMGAIVFDSTKNRSLFVRKEKLEAWGGVNVSLEDSLLQYVRAGRIDTVSTILGVTGVGIEHRDDQHLTPLLCAVEGRHPKIVKLLLDRHADWNAIDQCKRTALHIAAGNGEIDILQMLLKTEVNIDQKDDQGETALHVASKKTRPETVRELLKHNAKITIKDKKGNIPLHIAAKRSSKVIVEMLLEKNVLEENALNKIDEKKAYVDCRSESGRTPLLQACDLASTQDSVINSQLLLDNGADIQASDHNGETTLYLAAGHGNETLFEILLQESISLGDGGEERLKFINASIDEGRTALFEAVRLASKRICELLLDAGIDREKQDKRGRSALVDAVRYDKEEILQLLLEYKAQPRINKRRKKELIQSALFEAAKYDSLRVARSVIESGAEIHEKEATEQKTAIEIADRCGSQKVVALLLGRGGQLTSQGPSLGPVSSESESESRPTPMPDSEYDLAFGFKSTIVAFSMDTHEMNNIIRPPLRNVLYDHDPGTILTGLQDSGRMADFRWLHVPSNNDNTDRSKDDDNLMLVLPYFFWETLESRTQMVKVMMEAMQNRVEEISVSDPHKAKALLKTLLELKQIVNNPKEESTADSDEKSETDSYYTSEYAYTSTDSSDRRTQRTRRSRKSEDENQDDPIENIARQALASDPVPEKKSHKWDRRDIESREDRVRRIVNIAKSDCSADEKLILAHLYDEQPLHFRRTLDQYYYYTLRTTEVRDRDQVVSRYMKQLWPEEEGIVLMVDQLWLWILDHDTVVTSFPQRWQKSEMRKESDPDPNDTSDIVETVLRHIGKKNRHPLKTAFDLAELIVSKCVGTVFDHSDIAIEKLHFAEFFENSIGNVTNKEAKLFNQFADLSEHRASQENKENEPSTDLDALFDISKETKLIKEIKDIRDELHIVSSVLSDQDSVLLDMQSAIVAMKQQHGDDQRAVEKGASTPQAAPTHHSLRGRVRRHIATVEKLEKQSEKTYVALKDLLDLKQKQANVSEARSQRKQAQESAKQGTIANGRAETDTNQLPLSFLASFFALDIAEFTKNREGLMSLGYVSKIMFPVTLGVVALSLFLAFRVDTTRNVFGAGGGKYQRTAMVSQPTLSDQIIEIIQEGGSPTSTFGERNRRSSWDTSGYGDDDIVEIISEYSQSPPRHRQRNGALKGVRALFCLNQLLRALSAFSSVPRGLRRESEVEFETEPRRSRDGSRSRRKTSDSREEGGLSSSRRLKEWAFIKSRKDNGRDQRGRNRSCDFPQRRPIIPYRRNRVYDGEEEYHICSAQGVLLSILHVLDRWIIRPVIGFFATFFQSRGLRRNETGSPRSGSMDIPSGYRNSSDVIYAA